MSSTSGKTGSSSSSSRLGDVIDLDVGGVSYRTTRGTLVQYPGSMLAAMFRDGDTQTGVSVPPAQLVDGKYFLDRDGDTFKYILDYLRDAALPEASDQWSVADYRKLLREATYYQIQAMIDDINKKIEESRGNFLLLRMPSDKKTMGKLFGTTKAILEVWGEVWGGGDPRTYQSYPHTCISLPANYISSLSNIGYVYLESGRYVLDENAYIKLYKYEDAIKMGEKVAFL